MAKVQVQLVSNATAFDPMTKSPLPLTPGQVVLPCSVDDFRDFISGLLGKPQTIQRIISGPYELKREDVTDINGLVVQRVLSQNSGALIQFTATIYYHDNSSVRMDSYNDFASYNEVKPLISTGLSLSWVFLLQFPNKKAPERQTITIGFSTSGGPRTLLRNHRMVHVSNGDDITYSIDHTDRTWGADIDNLLEGALRRICIKFNNIRYFINSHHEKFGVGAFAIVMVISGFGLIDAANRISSNVTTRANQILSDYTVEKGTRLTAELLVDGAWAKFGLYGSLFFVLSFAFALFIGITVADLAQRSESSFVLLSKRAQEWRDGFKADIRSNWFKLAATGAVTGVGSVLGKLALTRLLGI